MIVPTYSFICAGGDGNRAVCPLQTPSQLPFSASLSLRLWNRNILSWLAEMFHCCTRAFWAPYQIHCRRCSQLVMCSLALVQYFRSWKVPVRQSRAQIFSPQSQRGVRTKPKGSGEGICGICVLFGQTAGSWAFPESQPAGKLMRDWKGSFAGGWWWAALNAPPKLGISGGFLGMALLHKRWTLSPADMVEVAW